MSSHTRSLHTEVDNVQPSPVKRTRFIKSLAAIALSIAVLGCCASMVMASSGDQQEEYISCVSTCDRDACQGTRTGFTADQHKAHDLDLSLRVTQWTCIDNCRYLCMHDITERAIEQNEPVHQYHGKWPFHRLLGMQEPASVLFSLLNGYMHVRALPLLKRTIPENYYMRPFYIGYALLGINTWLWSAVYHSRDWPSTEKLDYFSAGTGIMYGLFYSVIRITRMVNTRSQLVWGIACLIPLLLHIGYLTFVHFDYGYNMAATASIGLIHNIWWFVWSFMNRKERSYAWQPTVAALLVSCAMCLEILDFAPLWGIIDAHSLWHAATITLIPMWYRFLITDSEWEIRHKKGVLRSSHRD
ncbi:hypothetical protein FBU30_007253 [Linnemannia zychae]|nr:hypothetical protein FBU30_007253 [Linnemannia zychae]